MVNCLFFNFTQFIILEILDATLMSEGVNKHYFHQPFTLI